jgi:hypothetical protein
MKIERVEFDTPLDALIYVSKELSKFETKYRMASEEFYDQYSKGHVGDEADHIDWANEYRYYLELRHEVEGRMSHVA